MLYGVRIAQAAWPRGCTGTVVCFFFLIMLRNQKNIASGNTEPAEGALCNHW